ncbi:MAG TPA: glutaredoxin [Oribacterium sp.]|nr:glutaredoxin [Oribacterium sp.]
MKLVMYGSTLCQDTLYALMAVKSSGAEVDFHNITSVLPDLRAFMTLREEDPVYEGIGKERLGIPLFIYEDGSKTLELSDVLARIKEY